MSATPTNEFLYRLQELGIQLWAEGDRLRYTAKRGALTSDLKEEIAGRKASILRLLQQADSISQSFRPPLLPVPRNDKLPLSFAQQRLWFLDQLEPQNPFYNIPTSVRLTSSFDLGALRASLQEISRRHETFRTTFATVAGRAVQVIAPHARVRLPLIDLSGLAAAVREGEGQRLSAAEAARPFDLAQGPLLRTTVLRLGKQEHVVLLTMHHIISDGWSMNLLLNEVATLYQAYSRGERSPLPELAVQYADYAVWQREWLQGEVLEEQLAYWREQLGGGELPVLELPADFPRPAIQSHRGGHVPFVYSAEVTKGLQEVSRSESATMFMTLLAGFAVLLSRYSGQSEVVIGTDVAGRDQLETESLIGFFINQLVLRIDLKGQLSFREVLRRVRETMLGAYAHQDLPFEKLVEELEPARLLNRSPLFQVKLVFQKTADARTESSSSGLSVISVSSMTAKFDLTLAMQESGGRLNGALEYSRDLFEQQTVERMVVNFRVLLESIVADPSQPVARLILLTTEEREQLLVQPTRVEYAPPYCLHELFEEQVSRTPEALAVSYGAEQLSYQELNKRSNQLAHYLQRLGVEAEVRVGLLQERSVEMVVSVLAVLKAGGVYLPLDARLPLGRLSFMLEDGGAAVLLTEAALVAQLPIFWGQTIAVDEEWEQIAEESTASVESEVTAANLAYLIYTSGSTGVPKGVMLTHGGACNLARAQTELFGTTEESRVLQFASLSFDASVSEIFVTLASGGALVLAEREELAGEALGELLAAQQVTTVTLPPSILSSVPYRELPELKTLVVAGEASRAEVVEPWTSGRRVLNAYGPTEATVCASAWEWETGARLLIGRAIKNAELYVLDEEQELVPVGVSGELYIGGAGLARGYTGRAELTAEKFIAHPFSAGERLYRTGDLVRWRGNGELEFIGRIDEQVKVRGYRIELGEVESVLRQHPQISEAVVVVREEDEERKLVAYVVAEDTWPQMSKELRAHLRQHLPDYMIPTALVQLDQLPLTSSGKVDRRALPAFTNEASAVTSLPVAEATPVEQLLSVIWADLLNVEPVGLQDNFFELGGHSLLAMQVMSRVRKVFGLELGPRVLFELPILSQLAAHIEQELSAGEHQQPPPIVAVGRDRPLPLSFAQQRLWFLDQLEPQNPFYNIPTSVRLPSSFDLGALRASLQEISRRHETFRTTFATVAGRAVQVIAPHARVSLPLIDLSGLAAAVREGEEQRLSAAEAARPFDLAQGPLLRTTVLRLGEREHVVLLTMHHIISDGWSMNLLLNEVATLYQAYSRGERSPLPELAVQYADYAVWQREWLQGEVLEEQLAYWREQLGGGELPVLELPADFPRPAIQSHRGAYVHFDFSNEVAAQLRLLSRSESTTMFMTLLGAFAVLLARLSGQAEILIGSPIAGRAHLEVEPLIGFFINQLVLRIDLQGQPSFREVLGRVRETTLGAYAHQDVPFEKLVEELEPTRDLSRSPLFQVMFLLQNEAQESSGSELSVTGVSNMTAKFDLTLAMRESANRLGGTLEYNPDLFEQQTVERMVEHFRVLLESIAADATSSVMQVSLLTAAEREQLLVQSARVETTVGVQCLHQLFEEQAARTPGAVAITYRDRNLSYEELNVRANQLAHYLERLGVGPEVPVGVLCERSPELIVALLAVLKAGGAYVPLNAQDPAARLRFLLEDADVRVVLGPQIEELKEWSKGVRWVAEEDWKRISGESRENPVRRVDGENLAYVLYTSGSTGMPKGVMVAHQAVVNYLSWACEAYELGEGSGALLHSSLSFDLTVTSLWGPLSSGSRVVIVEAGIEELVGALERERGLSLVKLTPAHLVAVAGLSSVEQVSGAVDVVVVGGEALQWEQVRWWRAVRPAVRLVNEYGPTEATVGCSSYEVNGAEPGVGSGVGIGRGIWNTELYVLDEEQELVPVGVSGELYIGGAGLARGYLGRAELTAEKFVAHPYSEVGGERLYRSGDLVRWRGDGELEFLGRIDEQVKVRGYRVELGEVESVLRQHPQVSEAVVVVREVGASEKQLVAYVITEDGAEVPASELRMFLKEQLPEYMVPGVFVVLEALPLTQSGKVDRRALPAADAVAPAPEQMEAPRNEVEAQLAEIWREVLRLQQVSVHDNFFERGGDSILSIQIIARANQAGLRLTPKDLFQHQTIAELATVAVQARVRPVIEAELPLGPLPLIPIQQWFFNQQLKNAAHFNQAVLLASERRLERCWLEASLARLLREHDALRLRFGYDAERNQWQQQYAAAGRRLPLIDIDLSTLATGVEQARAIAEAGTQLQASLDIEAGPLLRLGVFELGEGEPQRLLWCIHHLAVDGVSWRILLSDWQTWYEQAERGEAELPSLRTTSYGNWAQALQRWAQSAEAEREADYWLEWDEVQRLPVDHGREENTAASQRSVGISLSAAQTEALLQQAPAVYHTRINDLLLTALGRALGRWGTARQVLIEMEGHGREPLDSDELDLTRTVGWFTSLYPLRLSTNNEEEIGAAIKRTKEELRGVPRQGLSYGAVRYLSEKPELREQLATVGGAEVSFNYLGQLDQALPQQGWLHGAGESSGASRDGSQQRSHLLDIMSSVQGGRLQVVVSYSGAVHERESVERLVESYRESLVEVVEHCASEEAGGYTPSDFPLSGLNQEQLDAVVGQREVEDVYVLSPMQEGLLFHALYAPQSAVYFEQVSCRLAGQLEVESFRRAWAAVIQRHSVLRSRFVWEGVAHAVQVVERAVELPWREEDWRELSKAEQEERLEAELERDRAAGFELGEAPLMRVTLLRLGAESYELIWSHHHLVLDGWSLPVLLREVTAYYEGYCRGEVVELGRSRSYGEYIRWLRAQDLEAAERYWVEQLRGFRAATKLGIEAGAAGQEAGAEYEEQRLSIAAETSNRLQQLSRAKQVTLNTIAQGAWGVLLSRYSGESDVVFGATVSGRPAELAGVETMVGLFINTLPVRVRVDGEQSVGDWLRQLQAEQLEARQYEYSPLIAVQSWSEVAPGEPLFETLFVFENYPMEVSMKQLGGAEEKRSRGRDKGLSVSRPRVSEQVNYPLSVTVGAAQEIQIRISYEPRRFTREAIERMLGHLEVLLAGIGANSTAEVSRLPLLSAAERRQVVEGNETGADYGPWCSVVAEFEKQVERRGPATAVVAEGVALSYEELNARANQLARYLQRLGVSGDARVGLLLERSVELVVGILGILKAGGAYVPLEPDYPEERLSFMVQDAGISIVLAQSRLSSSLAGSAVTQVYLDEEWPEISQESSKAIEVELWPENLAYVIYTSGSTGKPKGAMNTHRGIRNRLYWMQEVYGLTTDDRVLQKTPFSFDVSVWEFLWPLMFGARLILARPGGHQDSAYLVDLIAQQKVTTVHFVPSMLGLILDEPHLQDCRDLRRVICSGEALTVGLQAKFEERLDVEIHNLYGPTEAAVDVTFWKCERGEERRSVPIGRPIANTQIYLLDQMQEAVPIGVAGELHIGGDGLGRGYVNSPAQTAEKFIANPFSVAGERLYRTGDLARYLPDGNIEFLGRIDHQVKIRGHRIELGEVETALRLHPQVNDVVVVAREAKDGLNRLIGYIIPNLPEGQSPTVNELRNYLSSKLPDQMIPSAFVMMDQFPVLSNGKLDRKALPEPGKTLLPDDAFRIDNPFVAPSDPLETQLQKIYEEVLDKHPISINDNFFALGGNSLLVIRLVARINSQLGQQLPLPTIFDNPTIEKLANVVRDREWPNVLQLVNQLPPIKSPLVKIKPTGKRRPFFYVSPLGGVLPGNVLGGILELADYLDVDQPYYGLQLPELVQELVPLLGVDESLDREQLRAVFTRAIEERPPQQIIEDCAAQCIRAMRSVQPEGPYMVGGFCSGGIIAAEIALQLLKQEQEVAVLAIVDTEAPLSGPRNPEVSIFDHLKFIFDTTDEGSPLDEREITSIAWFVGRDLTGSKLAKDLPELQDDLRRLSPKERWAYAAEQVKTVEGKGSFEPEEIHRLYLIYQINLRTIAYILSNYRMPIYPGRVQLFRTAGGATAGHATDNMLGWSEYSFQPMTVHQLPGDHGSVFLPNNVKILAEQFTHCFNEAQGIESSEREERSGAREANMAAFVDRKVSLDQGEYHYRVYVPPNYTADEKWPLILFFHGEGESGTNKTSQTQIGLGPAIRRHPAQYPCLVVMPQCLERRSWGDPEMEMQAFAALQQTIDEFNVDEERIYLNGISSGGNAVWYFGAKYPDKFAAIVPMAGAVPVPGLSDEQYAAIAASFKQTPIWVFHGQADDIIDVAEPRKVVETLRGAKANVRYTEYEGVGHGAWELAYEEPDLIPWLLSQRRMT